MRLGQVSASDQLTQAVVRQMLAFSIFLGFLEFFNVQSEAVPYKTVDDPSGSILARAKGTDFASSTSLNKTQASATIKLLGLPVTIDKVERQTHNNIPALMERRILSVARNFAGKLESLLFTADGSSNFITGFTSLCDAGYSIAAAANGLDINTDSKSFLMLLDQYIEAQHGTGVIAVAPKMHAWMNYNARQIGATWNLTDYGVPIMTYNGIPVVSIGNSGIPITEDQGTATGKCTSVYLLKFGEEDNVSIPTTVGVDVTPVEVHGTKTIEDGLIELYGQPVLYRTDAIIRIKGLYFG